MKINREKSYNFRKIKINPNNINTKLKNGIIYTTVGIGLLNLNSAVNEKINESTTKNDNNQNISSQFDGYDIDRYKYFKSIEYASNQQYNESFLEYFKTGKLFFTIDENKIINIDLNKIRLVTFKENDTKVTYMIDSSKGNYDIFTGNMCDLFKISNICDFRYSNIFYEMYLNNKNQLKEDNKIVLNYEKTLELSKKIKEWNGTYHNELPETRIIYEQSNNRIR